MRRWIVALALLMIGCGGDGPTTPSPPAIVQVGGVWTVTVRTTSASGGDCLGPLFQGFSGMTSLSTAALTQIGSSLTATITDRATGLSCSYSGTAGTTTISMNITSCQANRFGGLRCSNGQLRDMQLFAGALNATVSGNSGSGTQAETWNVTNSSSGAPLGILTLNSSFTMLK